MRVTIAVARVLAALLDDPEAHRYGLDLMRATDLASGTLYPLLRRLQDEGWVTAEWENADPAAAGRPARRYYRLTTAGVGQARAALAEVQAATTPRPSISEPRSRPAW